MQLQQKYCSSDLPLTSCGSFSNFQTPIESPKSVSDLQYIERLYKMDSERKRKIEEMRQAKEM
jgi:hypothetical protein